MSMRRWKKRAAVMAVALMLTGCCSMPVLAKARVVKQPAGVTVTRDSITVDETASSGSSTDRAGAGSTGSGTAGSAGIGSSTGQSATAAASVQSADAAAAQPYDATVLDADDFYYVRAGAPLVIAQAGQRFHNVRVTDPQYLVEPKLGSAFRKIDLGDSAAPDMEFYQDQTDPTCYLWVQYDTNQTVQFLIYQRYPVVAP